MAKFDYQELAQQGPQPPRERPSPSDLIARVAAAQGQPDEGGSRRSTGVARPSEGRPDPESTGAQSYNEVELALGGMDTYLHPAVTEQRGQPAAVTPEAPGQSFFASPALPKISGVNNDPSHPQ